MYYNNIPGWFDYHGLYSQFVQNCNPNEVSKFVEVGVWLGKSICYMGEKVRESGKPVEIYGVDTWAGSINEQEHQDYVTKLGGPDKLFEEFQKHMALANLNTSVVPLRMASIEASKTFEDKSLDFVFIDASHDYENVKADIQAWLPKVKMGGVLAGHDWAWPDVNKAVIEVLKIVQTSGSCWIYKVN